MAKDKKTIKYEADISGFKKNIETANNNIKTLNNTLKLNQAQLKGNKESTQLLSERVATLKQKYEEQTKVVENTRSEYEKAVEVYGENSKEAENLKNKLIQAETKQQSIANAIKETNNQLTLQTNKLITTGTSMTEFGEKASKAGDKIEKIGNKLSIVSAGIATLAGASLKASIDYESAWTGVTKTVDGTEEQLAELRQGILDLSTQLPSAATEIAGVAENAGQLGIQTENVLSFSKAMIDLGNSTNLSADEASSQLAKFANIMQMSQKDFDKLGSSIVDLGNNFATTEADIVNMAMRLAGAGKQVGLSEGQVLGLATALSSVGIEAEMGGSAISKAMVKMQNAVELGGDKLNDVLNKTGMSLRDLELLSANNSKDFKALADSIGMTSTEVQQLITAGTNLEDFASVSGMTAEQFKKAWKEDASGALSAFIKGLGDAENKGESAITMLSEMGLTEVRLRDSLLRAANAGDLFNNAIETGTRAWEENTALANEANKRYETTESKLEMLKNEIVANGIALGDELKPALIEVLEEVKPIITNVTSLVKSFNKLDDATKKQIINAGAMVVAAGPVVKIGGKLITSLGNSAKSVGTLTKAIGVMKTGVNSGTKEVDSLAKTLTKTLTNIASPAGVATLAVGALAAGLIYLATKESEAEKQTKKLKEEVENQKQSWNELKEAREQLLANSEGEIVTTQELADELRTITDENGKVKEGYENRAKYILGELNKALETEYSMNDGIISQYQDLKNEIDKLIATKKAEVALNAYESEYQAAMVGKSQATKTLTELTQEYNKQLQIANDTSKTLGERRDAENQVQSLGKAIEEQNNLISEYGYVIEKYDNLTVASVSGSAEEIEKAISQIGVSYDEAKEKASTSLASQVQEQANYVNLIEQNLQKAKENNDTFSQDILESELETQKEQLENLVKSFGDRISTIESLSAEEVTTWATLARNNKDEYLKELDNLPEPVKQKVEKAVEGVQNAESLLNGTFSNLGEENKIQFGNQLKLKETVQDKMQEAGIAMNNDTTISNASAILAQNADTGFNNNVDGNKWGTDLSENISAGMTSQKSRSGITGAATTVAGWISKFLHFSLPEEGPLSDFDESMPDMIDLMVKGIKNNKYKVVNSVKSLSKEMKEGFDSDNVLNLQDYKIQNTLNPQITDKTKTIFTTPNLTIYTQEFDARKIANEVNKVFGSQY